MKISDLIKLLEEVKERHGDLEIFGMRLFSKNLKSFHWQFENFITIRKKRVYLVFQRIRGKTDWELSREIKPENLIENKL